MPQRWVGVVAGLVCGVGAWASQPPPGSAGAADDTVTEREVAPAPAEPTTATPPAEPVRDYRVDRPQADPLAVDGVEDLSLGWTLFRTLVVLAMVVMLAYLTLNVGLRRLLGIKSIASGQAVVEVLERVPLDQKRALFVVKAAGEVLLIGGSDNSLELITRLDAAEVQRLRAKEAPGLQMSPFLQKLLGRKDAPPPAS
jgi:flagellar biogenesis protein FliO